MHRIASLEDHSRDQYRTPHSKLDHSRSEHRQACSSSYLGVGTEYRQVWSSLYLGVGDEEAQDVVSLVAVPQLIPLDLSLIHISEPTRPRLI
eukprot:1849912-Rhodomonas_salina.3